MNLPSFIPFSFPQGPWISVQWFYIFISIKQGLKKIKGIKFKTNSFSCFRKKVENTLPGTKKNGNYGSISRLYVSLPWVWSGFYAYSDLFALLLYQHIHMYHLLHFLYAFTALSISFAFSSTSELQVPSKLMALSANKVSGKGYSIPSTDFPHSHIN